MAAPRTHAKPAFFTGRPIGTTSAAPSRGQVQQLASTAASVGPYRLLSTTGPLNRSWKRRTSAGGSASPLHTTWRSEAQRPASTTSTNGCSMEGTKCSAVTPSRSTVSRR